MNMLSREFTRREWLAAIAGLVATAAVPAFLRAASAGPKAGDTLPDLTSFGLEGTLPDLKGKTVLIDFWASWCGPCKKSFPSLAKLHEKYSAKGFLILAVSVDEEKEDMDKFLEKNPVPFPVVRDPKSQLAEKLGIDVMPTSILVGADGKIRMVHRGFEGESTRKQYQTDIEAALAAK
ncbi:MAG: TlpA family protein disulfide reductase [Pedosphaera sp.]|nr:TlpA family protein disulfide reductase [Pedosphaera sp.]